MIEAYSLNLTVETNPQGSLGVPVPFNAVNIKKGCSVNQISPSTFLFNKNGVYMIAVNANVDAAAAGDVTLQLTKNNVVQPQATATVTGVTGDYSTLSFVTLLPINETNTGCCATPANVQLLSTATGFTGNVNICITKVC